MARLGLALQDRIVAAEKALALAPATGNWGEALELFAQSVGGWGCHLNSMAPDLGLLSSLTGGIPCELPREFAKQQGASPTVNKRAAAIYDAPLGVPQGEADFTTRYEWMNDYFFQNFLLRVDAPYSLFAKLSHTQKAATTVTVLRSKNQDHASAIDKTIFNRLLPTLYASVDLQNELDARNLNFAAQSLSLANVTAFICDPFLKIITASEAGENALLEQKFVSSKGGKLTIVNDKHQRNLQRAVLFASLLFDDRRSCANIKIRGKNVDAQCALAIAPLPADSSILLRNGVIVMLLEEATVQPGLPAKSVHLTGAEKEIGKLLVRGHTTSQIAEKRAVSKATVQTQIKAMSAKLSASHRAELLIALQRML
ncbi:LuxR C-terminal-related transcriptional regulator [Hyphococcus flavus]|uniref:LuxR C-terminal-related transcriptional regulator n=1 Tax=Hyphococcus flavus TaxID=1866326 RepID=A0AAE9ZJV8_9PROT|nr:LuxR C-terminal-related transcriptional regulator [Hyphococcus flavus]WDI32466.1 LuxR C-terminal-related transcriptional regulator [Hyphococcus flavus]